MKHSSTAALHHRHALQPWRAWLLVALLLAAQAFGLAHRIEHAPGDAQRVRAHGEDPATAQPGGHSAVAAGGHQRGDVDCRLIDQLGHADGLCGTAPSAHVPALATSHAAARAAGMELLAPRAAYQARAPPRV